MVFPFPLALVQTKIDLEVDHFALDQTDTEETLVTADGHDDFVLLPNFKAIQPLSANYLPVGCIYTDEVPDMRMKMLTDTGGQALINYCAKYLVSRVLNGNNTVLHDRIYDQLFDGLILLDVCFDLWHTTVKKLNRLGPLAASMSRMKRCMIRLPPHHQLAFWRLLEVLHGTFHWVEDDEKAVKDQDFEVSTTIWFMKLDPHDLVAGWQ